MNFMLLQYLFFLLSKVLGLNYLFSSKETCKDDHCVLWRWFVEGIEERFSNLFREEDKRISKIDKVII